MSVVGIDLGGKSSVIAQAQKGGIKTVLNGASQRLSSSLVSIKGPQRSLASTADTMVKSNYKNTVWYANRLIGRELGSADLEKELALMPFSKFIGESKTTPGKLVITLKVDGEDEEFTPQQVLAMLLGQLQRDAVAETPNVTTSDLVVTVPCWFTDTQRQQLLEACEIANLNCHGLINDTTAVALNYGIWKNARGAFKDEENYYVMFLNFGATQYSVQIVKFSEGKMTVKSTTHDRFLGGRVIDMAIADKLVAGFKEQTKGLDTSRTANPKAYLKLLIQAEKAKKNLCGGIPAIKVNCECLMEDRDLSNFLLKKEDLEEICTPLADRMIAPIEQALAETGLQFSDLKSIEATGGTMRMPIFKQKVGSFFNLPQTPPNYGLMTTMDMDESAGSGCALMCAMLSPKFNVKPFEVEDAVQFPVSISWEKPESEVADDENKMDVDEDGEQGTASVSASGTDRLILFQRNGVAGARKIAFRRNKVSTPYAPLNPPLPRVSLPKHSMCKVVDRMSTP